MGYKLHGPTNKCLYQTLKAKSNIDEKCHDKRQDTVLFVK